MVVAAYGLILPQEVLDTPKPGCLNIRTSLLPRWRGAAPIQRAIDQAMPRQACVLCRWTSVEPPNDVVSEHRYAIQPTITANEVHDALMEIGAAAVVADLQQLRKQSRLNAVKQPEEGVTYAPKN